MPLSGQCSPRRGEHSDRSRVLTRKYLGLLSLSAWRQHHGWLGRLISGGGKAAAVQAGGMMLTFAVNILLARAAGVEGYGTYSFVLALASFAAVCGRLGWTPRYFGLCPNIRLHGQLGGPASRGHVEITLPDW